MSLYDKAKVIFSAAAGAGNEEVAYNIKPVEKLKVDELLTNGGFDSTDDWQILPGYTTVSITDGKLVFTNSAGNAYHRARSSEAVFEIGKTYRVSFEVSDFSRSGGGVKIGALEDDRSSFIQFDKDGKYSTVFTAVGYDHGSGLANTELVFKVFGGVSETVSCKIDNVSVREVEQKANDFSFVRASDLTATYEGPDGLIKKTRENLLTYSNDFDNAIWAGSSTWTSGQSGYDGSTNAWSFNKNSPSGSDFYNQFFHGLHTFSIYAKKRSNAGLAIYAFYDWNGSSFGGSVRLVYNLDTGTELANQSGVISTTCEAIGSSWWRITMTVEQDDMRWYLYTTDGTETLVDDVTVTLQDAQLEQGLVATPYIHRTDSYSKSTAGIQEDEPRYDYSLDNDAPPVLMLEPERKNELKHSEHIKASFWSAINTITVTSNNSTSPEGLENATSVDGGDDYPILKTDDVILETSTDYVFSFYAKNVDSTDVHYRVYDEDLNTDIVSSTSYFSQLSTTEWNRIEVPFTTHSSSTNYKFYLVSGDMNGEILVWGSQVEKGSCVTSYIPTYGSAGTRKADTIPQYTPSKTNLDKYTFFAHSHSDRVASDNRAPRLKGDGNSALMGHFVNTAGKKQFFLYDNENNSTLSKATFGSFEAGDDTKYAFVVDNIALEAKLFIDGLLRETISLTERVDAKILSVGNSDGNPDRIKSIMYFPEALEDGDVVSLTT